ncbi:MAG: ABC transporter ATP-binding protein [Firmicutes bacterium]|jgi:ABC-type lipoprotein export system ATPase subunit|nr:ABC transporter ATP-binding protein [Candidatus Fermentithermobacillaceae bacterium]
MAILTANKLSRVYGGKRSVPTWALRDASLAVNEGEFIGVMGPSGSGKTTLLNLLAAIDTPTSGTVEIDGVDISTLSDRDLAIFRRRKLGFVFQDYNLLHTLSIEENIVLPLVLDGVSPAAVQSRLSEVAHQLGIQYILEKRVFQVSGGEQQRAAIARAIIHRPALILADEPTGNLDSKSSAGVMKALRGLSDRWGATILMVTHDAFAASFCERILFIRDGRIRSQIHRLGSRESFYEDILSSLRAQGGDGLDASQDKHQ